MLHRGLKCQTPPDDDDDDPHTASHLRHSKLTIIMGTLEGGDVSRRDLTLSEKRMGEGGASEELQLTLLS